MRTKQIQIQEQEQVFKVKRNAPIKKRDAQVVGNYLYSNQDKLETREILDDIKRDRTNPLNNYLEWDNKKAGDKWRLQQLRMIYNCLEVEIVTRFDSKPQRINAFVSVKNGKSRRYVYYEKAFSQPDYKNQVLTQAKQTLKYWVDQYEQYQELSKSVRVIKTVIRTFPKTKKRD